MGQSTGEAVVSAEAVLHGPGGTGIRLPAGEMGAECVLGGERGACSQHQARGWGTEPTRCGSISGRGRAWPWGRLTGAPAVSLCLSFLFFKVGYLVFF